LRASAGAGIEIAVAVVIASAAAVVNFVINRIATLSLFRLLNERATRMFPCARR
jgi:hypothetical protein